jgi:predicted metalloprotease
MTPEAEKALRARIRLLITKIRLLGMDIARMAVEIEELKKRESEGDEWKNL